MAHAQHGTAAPGSILFTGRFHWAGYLLGFSLGGFFDGILLHQILQWHHLLSGLEGDAFRDIRVQILADGLFHALMYVLAAAGLWLLWRARREFTVRAADRVLFANALIGFGVWHIVDTLFSHWLTGIHRIRMDSPNPLLWDILWLVLFGLIPLAIGIALRRRGGTGSTMHGSMAAALLGAAVLSAGAYASLPPPGVSQVMVYFKPGTSVENVYAAADAVGGTVIWSDQSGDLWAFDLPDTGRAPSLYGHGALFVGNTLFPAVCLNWSRAR